MYRSFFFFFFAVTTNNTIYFWAIILYNLPASMYFKCSLKRVLLFGVDGGCLGEGGGLFVSCDKCTPQHHNRDLLFPLEVLSGVGFTSHFSRPFHPCYK